MATFNGHKNWNHWNVSLWLSNDESLYRTMRQCVYSTKTRTQAAETMLELLKAAQHTSAPKTPDGAPYSVTSIRAAMVGLK